MTGVPEGIEVSEEVRQALADGVPVVALESTIISHGLPRPANLDVARELESSLRSNGVVPATVGVLEGVPVVGVPADGLERLAGGSGPVEKASVRDLAVVAGLGLDAGTTVAATAFLAERAGVRCFATGGIGGVHRGARDSFDESADLVTLSRTPMVVVCAGVKSILDVGATLERLETLGVTVVGYGTDRFPGFYVADSGHAVSWAVSEPGQVASVAAAVRRLGAPGAVVVANPVPAEHQLDRAVHDRAVTEALASAAERGITGKAVTPFVLDYLYRATAGASLEANVWAVRNNVVVAAAIARAIAEGSASGPTG